jgi:hypothetical protein
VCMAVSSACGPTAKGYKSSFTLAFSGTHQAAAVHRQIRDVLVRIMTQTAPLIDWETVLDSHIYHPRSSTRMLFHSKCRRTLCRTCRSSQQRQGGRCCCGNCAACIGYCPASSRHCPLTVDRRPSLPWMLVNQDGPHTHPSFIPFATLLSGQSHQLRTDSVSSEWSRWQSCYPNPETQTRGLSSSYQLHRSGSGSGSGSRSRSWNSLPYSNHRRSQFKTGELTDGECITDDTVQLVVSRLKTWASDPSCPAVFKRWWMDESVLRDPKPTTYGWCIPFKSRHCHLRLRYQDSAVHSSEHPYLTLTTGGCLRYHCFNKDCRRWRTQLPSTCITTIPSRWLAV